MNEALAQVTSRKCLTHSALDEDSATGALQPTTHPLDADAAHASLKEEPSDTDTAV